jgi:hypothetical protein
MTRWLRMHAALASASQHRITREGQNRTPLGIQCLVFSGSWVFRLLGTLGATNRNLENSFSDDFQGLLTIVVQILRPKVVVV